MDRIRAICEALVNEFPNPAAELDFSNNYTLLVAVVLSARNTDRQVNKVTEHLFNIADSPEKMLALGYDNLCEQIKSIGLYRNKARYIIELSDILIKHFNGNVPDNKDDLIKLPGVGEKTANVVMNHAFNAPTIAVDTHVFRVSHRLGLSEGKTPSVVEKDLVKIIPDEFKLHIGYQILLHGRYICKSRRPDCDRCCLKELCVFKCS